MGTHSPFSAKKTVFLHTLLGAGSSWLVDAFQRSGVDYAEIETITPHESWGSRIHTEPKAFHVYLWRNPRDQWLACQATPSFAQDRLLSLNARSSHPLIEQLHQHLGVAFSEHDSLSPQTDDLSQRPRSPADGYRVFYTLWLLGLSGAVDHADLLINSDALAVNDEERHRCISAFESIGVTGLQRDDCPVSAPLCIAHERQDLAALEQDLTALEQDIHTLWSAAGMSAERLEQLQQLRRQYEPRQQAAREPLGEHEQILRREIARVRQAAWAKEIELQAAHTREIHAAEARIEALEKALLAIHTSTSWRATAFLRHGASHLYLFRQRLPAMAARMKQRSFHLLSRSARELQSFLRRHPRLAAPVLALLNRFPALQRSALRLLQPAPLSFEDTPVTLNARSAELYRQLIAAVETHNNADAEGRPADSKHVETR